jgi:hypothetical protein
MRTEVNKKTFKRGCVTECCKVFFSIGADFSFSRLRIIHAINTWIFRINSKFNHRYFLNEQNKDHELHREKL